MRRIYLDTNILLDILINTRPGHEMSLQVLALLKRSHIEIFCSTQSLFDTYYVAGNNGVIKQEIDVLCTWLVYYANVRPIGWMEFKEALMSAEPDIEDAAQISLAKTEHCDLFLTNDQRVLNKEHDAALIFMSPAAFIDKATN
ncbi:MAG: PIN domain-containing protein [Bacteroidales bacterium]|nr:PIN domain-containing protein [Bacteroidales bacterium]